MSLKNFIKSVSEYTKPEKHDKCDIDFCAAMFSDIIERELTANEVNVVYAGMTGDGIRLTVEVFSSDFPKDNGIARLFYELLLTKNAQPALFICVRDVELCAEAEAIAVDIDKFDRHSYTELDTAIKAAKAIRERKIKHVVADIKKLGFTAKIGLDGIVYLDTPGAKNPWLGLPTWKTKTVKGSPVESYVGSPV